MANPYVMQQSRAIPVDVDTAFRGTLPIPLPVIFSRRYGPIGPVKAISGQTRTVTQAGGGSMKEELTRIDPPRTFGYTLTDITGPLSPLVDHIEGEWLFEPAGTGTRVTWRWAVHPKSGVGAVAMPVFARLWRGFARQALEELSDRLVG